MGSPKQLLRLAGESLVRRAATTALASRAARVFVVVGAGAEAVAREIEDLPVEPVENVHWAEGIGSSIRAGVSAAMVVQPPLDAVLITLADQPAVTSALLDELIAASEAAPAGLVACEYAETLGVPALFARRHFDALRRLSGDRGGKALLAAHGEAVVRIRFAPAAIDLDTPADYTRLCEHADAITPQPRRQPARARG